MKKLVASALTLALLFGVQPMVAPLAAQNTASISGNATDAKQTALQGGRVQLRHVETGPVNGSTNKGANGAFSFPGLPAGKYLVEIVTPRGRITGASALNCGRRRGGESPGLN